MSTARLELPNPRISQAKFRDETSRRGNKCNVCETLICKLVYLFIVFGEQGRYIDSVGSSGNLERYPWHPHLEVKTIYYPPFSVVFYM